MRFALFPSSPGCSLALRALLATLPIAAQILPLPPAGAAQHTQRATGQAVVNWRESLTPEQRAMAEAIIAEARPRIQGLRQQVRAKMGELKSFAYDDQTDPDVLPRLGRELQELRDALHREILEVRERIARATGVSLPGRPGRGCAALDDKGF